MILDGCKAKHEPTGATTAEEQPSPPQIALAKRDVAERDSFKLILKVFLFILLTCEEGERLLYTFHLVTIQQTFGVVLTPS